MGRVSGTVVFLGPSLPVAEAGRLLPASYLPPARMGDVHRAGRAGATVIGIVDGYYERVPAVWHKEILWALSEGIRVFGASSMGAMRAAELDAFGMVGVGEVYRQYRDGVLVDDDEVALLHGPAESGYRPASVPLVNIRATLGGAVAAGVLTQTAERGLIALARDMHYPERSYESVAAAGVAAGVLSTVEPLLTWCGEHAVDQKRLDAVELLDVLRAVRPPRRPAPARTVFEPTWIWEHLVQETGTPPVPAQE